MCQFLQCDMRNEMRRSRVAGDSLHSPSDAPSTHARRLFALSRMVEVLLYNLVRLHDFWPLLLDHIVELLSDTRAPARLAAIEALNRALIGALAARLQLNAQACSCP